MYDYNIKPFKFWCQKVLPLVYDDSLSYMELLCKVVNYLNHVIDDVNQLPEYIQNLVSEDVLKDILGGLLDQLREQIVPANEGKNTTASVDRKAGDLVWLDGKLVIITRDILAGTQYIEATGSVGITGNYIYTTIKQQMNVNYSSDNHRLTIHGYFDEHTEVITRGDRHIYNGATQTIEIVEA